MGRKRLSSSTAVTEADVVVGDWHVLEATAVAHKLIIPTPAQESDWLGTTPLTMATAVALTIDALKQIMRGEPIQATGPSLGQLVGYAVLTFVGLSVLVPLLIFIVGEML